MIKTNFRILILRILLLITSLLQLRLLSDSLTLYSFSLFFLLSSFASLYSILETGPGTFLLTRTAQVDISERLVYFYLLSKMQIFKSLKLNSCLVPVMFLSHLVITNGTNVVGNALKNNFIILLIIVSIASVRSFSSFIHRFLWGSERGAQSMFLLNICNLFTILAIFFLSRFSFQLQQTLILVLVFLIPLTLELMYLQYYGLLSISPKFDPVLVRKIRNDITSSKYSISGGSLVAILGAIGFKLDSLIVGIFCSPNEVVNLGTVTRIFGVIVNMLDVAAKKWWVFLANNIYHSDLSQIYKYLRRAYLRVLIYGITTILTTVILFKPIAGFIIGDLATSIPLSLIVAGGCLALLNCLAGPGAMLISAASLSHKTLLLQALSSIINVALSIILIANIGPVGSPLASSLTLLFLIPGEFVIGRRNLDIPFRGV